MKTYILRHFNKLLERRARRPRCFELTGGSEMQILSEQFYRALFISGALLTGTSAYASDWYLGMSCMRSTGMCVSMGCILAPNNYSPAKDYDDNAWQGAKIVDKGDEVDVVIPGKASQAYFRSVGSCNDSTARELRKGQEFENKYR
jgi:hypothetical protein